MNDFTNTVHLMDIKFFPRDVIGKQPEKKGDQFTAMFFGKRTLMRVTVFGSGCFMAVTA